MNRNKTFCEECRRDVEYMVETATIKGKLKGEEYEYTGKKAVCTECGSEVYVADIEDENLKALYDTYRQKNGIISLEKILEIPQKYNIGKRPLSLLLGWGEMTFSRYCEGDMPTKQYSDILQKIYDDPAYYKELLEKNKDNLKSLQAYEKSKRKVQELLGEENKTGSKLDSIIQYLLYKCEDITPLALQKALYYVQGFYYAFEGRFLFEEDCEAWVHGPVYRDIYNRYSSYRFDPIESVEAFDESVFTTAEKAILDSVIKNFCCYSGKTLEKFTHLEKPWRHTRDGLPVDAHSNRVIPKELIGKYFDIHTSLGRKSVWDERFPRDPETLIKDMAYYRIHGSLFIQNEGMEYSLIQGNRKGIETAEKYKGLYLAATMIPAMKYEWDEPFEYDILNQEKVKAVHIAPKSVRHLFTPKAMEKLCLTMQSKDLPLILSITQTDWSELERFLDAYPSVNVILTDTAWSHNRYLFSLLGRYKNLHFDISSNQSNDILEVTKQYFGIERALFGSDYPFKVMGGLKALVEYARLSEEEKDAVACGNACRLLHIDEKDLELYRGEPDFDEAASLVDQGKPLTSYYIIDAHAHMSGDGIYTLSDLVMKNGDAKSMVRTMDELGIDCTITVPWEGISVNGTNANKTCQKAMSDFPGRFLSYASLNPNYREELETVIPEFHEKDKGFVGIKPYYPKHGLDILDEKYKEWYEYANKRKLLMLLHTGSSSIYPKIPKLCETYPDIAILLAHSGSSYPNADFMIDVAKRYKNAYLEITYTSLTRGIIEYMVEKVGADKVLFGTDTPMRDPAPQLAWVAYSRISIEDKRKILGGNMKKLLERIERD